MEGACGRQQASYLTLLLAFLIGPGKSRCVAQQVEANAEQSRLEEQLETGTEHGRHIAFSKGSTRLLSYSHVNTLPVPQSKAHRQKDVLHGRGNTTSLVSKCRCQETVSQWQDIHIANVFGNTSKLKLP